MQEFKFSGRSSAWLERLVWDQEVAGSNPVAPIFCRLPRNREERREKSQKKQKTAIDPPPSSFSFHLLRLDDHARLKDQLEEIARMLAGLIKGLETRAT